MKNTQEVVQAEQVTWLEEVQDQSGIMSIFWT